MKSESLIRILAGTMVLAGLVLSQFVSAWWLVLPAFVALNLIQSALTGICPPEKLFRKLGWVRDCEGGCCGR